MKTYKRPISIQVEIDSENLLAGSQIGPRISGLAGVGGATLFNNVGTTKSYESEFVRDTDTGIGWGDSKGLDAWDEY